MEKQLRCLKKSGEDFVYYRLGCGLEVCERCLHLDEQRLNIDEAIALETEISCACERK